MAIEVEKAYLADSSVEGTALKIDLDHKVTRIALPGVLRGSNRIRIQPRYWAVIFLTGGRHGEDVRLSGYFSTPGGVTDSVFSSKQKWTSKGRHVVAIRLAGEKIYFTGDGHYELRFTLSGAELCTIPFEVIWSDAIPGSEDPDD